MVGQPNGDSEEHAETTLEITSDIPKPLKSPGDDPQAQLIATLRSQISDLFSQVTQLNNKLVQSYDRVSDLEDNLHISSSNLRSSTLKISQLELERTQHLAALNTGLLVEKDNVTAELTRLMERATEEAARRGQAESARENIEKDLDDLSASLFDQANTMVAEARFQRAKSERKVEEAEEALRGAEDAVSSMQLQMQQLREEKERSDNELVQMRTTMGKGKWVERAPELPTTQIRLLSLHLPYQEFLLFVAHLRTLRPSTQQPPAMSTLLPLPFLARILSEDSDPTVRLDFAPSLNWLSRRSVLSAIYSGQLTIEPISSTTLILESFSSSLASPMIPGSHYNVSCALCGISLFPPSLGDVQPPPAHPLSRSNVSNHNSGSWSTSLFKNPLTNSANPSPPLTPTHPTTHFPNVQVHVFRLAQQAPPSLPQQNQQKPTNYPLCASGWCLARLRTTCSLWAFIRTGVVDKVWEEEVPTIVPPPAERTPAPPLPPRRRSKIGSMTMGSLWGMASGALSKEKSPTKSDVASEKSLPNSPRPASSLLPAVNIKQSTASTAAPPPPLPKRSMERDARARTTSGLVPKEDDKARKEVSGNPDVAKDDVPDVPADNHIEPTNSQSSEVSQNTEANPAMPTASDVFSTPVEELESLPTVAERAISPSTIPLPDSRPSTPVHVIQNEENHAMKPSPTAGSVTATPPPLPRRAAARRPVPGPPPSQPQVHPGTESPEVTRVAGNAPKEVEDAPASNTESSTTPSGLDPSQTAPVQSTNVESAKVEDQPPPQPDVRTEEPTPRASSPVQIEQKDPTPDRPTPHHPPPPPPRHPQLNGKEKKDVVAAPSADAQPDPFVGDVTWEERTWKELVRLREDMFWARAGALRQ